ncbi:MAG: TlpA family protein disulfide reductase [Ignavibacteria bacterium]|jgi:thiol-disulfide isomerase/thioredoxin|nr:TlpA family protein disulfide reductase [Ignavibacteria bacterium]MCU7502947.1 TlpA family protein disulfide reductase [Ignavibacteria bacterium]MCU7517070.1 TlpA family protein disulfide reductase [Ignavibacteria bacterium]
MKKLILVFLFIIGTFSSVLFAQKVTISGRILGNDGRPLAKAVAEVYDENSDKFTRIPVEKDGSFTIETESKYLELRLSGVNHRSTFLPVIIHNTEQLKFDVLLATNSYIDDFSKVKMICSINDYSRENPYTFKKNDKGIYFVDIDTEKDTIEYELIGLSKQSETHSWNGTMSDDFKYDSGGDFRSVIYKKGKTVHIEFDPSKLIPENTEEKIVAEDETLPEIIMLKNSVEYNNNLNRMHLEAADNKDKRPDFSAAIEGLRIKAFSEKDQFLKGYYSISYLKYWPYIENSKFDTMICRQTIEAVPPESDLWMINPNLLAVMTRGFRYENKGKFDKYIKDVVEVQKNTSVKAEALRGLIWDAKVKGDTASFNAYIQRILKDCPNTYQAKSIKADFLTLMVGADVPDFEVKSLSDENVIYSNKTLKGKFYLMDFWATWCGPCVGELPGLHEAYQEFKDKNFEILSISLDGSREDVVKFREGKFKMPWLHAFLDKSFNSEIAKKFGITGIPKVVLVSDQGKILAIDMDARGENLKKTLEKYLNSGVSSK